MLSVKQGGIKYYFWVFGMTRPRIEPRSPGTMANSVTIVPMPDMYRIIQYGEKSME